MAIGQKNIAVVQNKKSKFKLALMVGVSIFSANIANAQIAPKPGFPQDRYKEFTPDKEVEYGKLANGMRFAIQKWSVPKGEISIRMRIAAGSLNEKANQSGLMHFLEHMAFNGSENIKEGDMIPLLEKEGLAFGADTNAHTSFDETVYKLDMPKPEQLDLGLRLMRETASRLTLAKSAIDDERGIIKGEERARMSPAYKQWIDYANTVYSGYLFPKRLPIGDMNVVGTAPQKEFKALYEGLYRPERTFLVIVGDIEPKAAKAAIEKHFNDWKGKGVAANDPQLGKLAQKVPKFKNYVDKQLPTSVALTALTPHVQERDTSAERREGLLLEMANSMLNDRFSKIARDANAPFVSASASTYDWFNQINAADLDVTPKDEAKWDLALKAADLELRSALTYGFTDAEFQTALSNVELGYKKSVSQDGARRSRAIANSILGSFEADVVHTNNADDLAWFNKVKPSLNKSDAQMQLKKYWNTQNQNLYVVTQNPIKGGGEVLKAKFSEIRTIAPKKPVNEVIKSWDYTSFGAAGNFTRVDNAEIGATFVKFDNNVRLVVKPSDFEKGRVRVAVRFGDGKYVIPSDKIGVNLSAASAFDGGGLGHYDVDELKKVLAGKNVGRGFSVSDDAFEFNAVTSNDDLLTQMQIFAAYMTDPAWRTNSFSQLKAMKDNIYKDERSTPDNVFWRKLEPILTSNHPSTIFPSQAQFEELKFEDGKNFIEPALKSSAMEIIVVGDTNVESSITNVAQTLGALPKRDATPKFNNSSRKFDFAKGRNIKVLDHDGRLDQGIGSIFYPTTDYGDGVMGRKLRVLGDMLNIKLTDIIREKEGGTYSPQVMTDSSTIANNFGYMGVVLNVKPEEIDKYIAQTEAITKDFAMGKIDEDLLKRAKAPAIASIETTMHNNPWWVSWLKNSSFDESRIKIIRDGKKQYEDVTLEDVKSLAKQYFDPNKAQIIKVMPKSLVK